MNKLKIFLFLITGAVSAQVGIGTTTPVSQLHVNGGDISVTSGANAGGDGGAIKFGIAALSNFSEMSLIKGQLSNVTPTELQGGLGFFTRPTGAAGQLLTQRMIIDASGNVGIGTISPAEKLDIAGNVSFSGALKPNGLAGTTGQVLTSNGAGTPTWQSPAAASTTIYSGDGTIGAGRAVGVTDTVNFDANTFVINGTNNSVGIGTASPGERLDVNGAVTVSGQAAANKTSQGTFDYNPALSQTRLLSWGPDAITDGTIGFWTGVSNLAANERMRIDSNGNVGIGTNAPAQKLDVVGNISFTGALRPNNISGTAGQVLTSNGAGTPTWETPVNVTNKYNSTVDRVEVNHATAGDVVRRSLTLPDAGTYLIMYTMSARKNGGFTTGLLNMQITVDSAIQSASVREVINTGRVDNDVIQSVSATFIYSASSPGKLLALESSRTMGGGNMFIQHSDLSFVRIN